MTFGLTRAGYSSHMSRYSFIVSKILTDESHENNLCLINFNRESCFGSDYAIHLGFPSNASPTIVPSAPVSLKFFSQSSCALTFPLLSTTTCSSPDSSRMADLTACTHLSSAAPFRRWREATWRACRVTTDAPARVSRTASKGVRDGGLQRRSFTWIGIERFVESFDTVN
jgi:hypothetical protein